MKKLLTILFIILAVTFGILASFSMSLTHLDQMEISANCPMNIPGCLKINNSNAMTKYHISILKTFGESSTFFKLLLRALFLGFYLYILQKTIPAKSLILKFKIKKVKIFKKIFRWLSILKYSYPLKIKAQKE